MRFINSVTSIYLYLVFQRTYMSFFFIINEDLILHLIAKQKRINNSQQISNCTFMQKTCAIENTNKSINCSGVIHKNNIWSVTVF